jgi:hypothetical protein
MMMMMAQVVSDVFRPRMMLLSRSRQCRFGNNNNNNKNEACTYISAHCAGDRDKKNRQTTRATTITFRPHRYPARIVYCTVAVRVRFRANKKRTAVGPIGFFFVPVSRTKDEVEWRYPRWHVRSAAPSSILFAGSRRVSAIHGNCVGGAASLACSGKYCQ